MNIAQNLLHIKRELPTHVRLVAVSKTHPVAMIQQAYDAGHRVFGENKVQELTAKHQQLPTDIEWHFIGHLQTNKVKYIAPFIGMIHGVDSLKLLAVIDKEAKKCNRVIDCLLQFYVAQEETKHGLTTDEAHELLNDALFGTLKNVRIRGVMGMATFTDNTNQIRTEFETLSHIFQQLKQQYFSGVDYFNELSMGMSGDYTIAVSCGSTLVRVGSLIFGERDYSVS